MLQGVPGGVVSGQVDGRGEVMDSWTWVFDWESFLLGLLAGIVIIVVFSGVYASGKDAGRDESKKQRGIS